MRRRTFVCALSAAGLLRSETAKTAAFPVQFKRANPFDAALRCLEPGSDEFEKEKGAVALEDRLRRVFAGLEPAPFNLQPWVEQRKNIRTARFDALPGGEVRFELKFADEKGLRYETGTWKLPDFTPGTHTIVTSPKPYFRDVTSHVFGKETSFQQQLLQGNPYWRARLDSAAGVDVFGNQGIAVGDIDNDGGDEIYVCQPGGLPNRLFKLRADGSAQDLTASAGVGVLDDTTSALFADFRNSGLQDLVVLRAQGPLLFLNQGNGKFREQPDAFHFASSPRGSFTGMAAADYNRDGRLDLYLCCYVYFQSEDQYQFPAPYHDARNGPPNFLFRNTATQGGIVFEDVTAESGIDQNNDRFSFAPAWCDFDGDGWPDLYVANDFGRNNFYRNRQGHFRDEAASAGVEDIGPGMSASWFDYDGDGHPDLYVSNMWTAAGKRVVNDPHFRPAVANTESYRRHTKGNSLYRNRGDGTFEEKPEEGVEMGRWAWGSSGFDLDLDGSPEILIATGMVTNPGRGARDLESFFWRQVVARTPEKQTAAPEYENGWSAINQVIREDQSWSGNQPNVFYVRRNGRYEDASGVSGFDFADDSRAFAITDFDGDGNPDILLRSRLGPQVRALQNDCTQGRKAIAVSLRGSRSNRDAIGARVEVNGQAQWLQAGSGFLSQHSKKLHFGLNGKDAATVHIVWPSGLKQEFHGLEAGFFYTFIEGEEAAVKKPFLSRRLYSDAPVTPVNAPQPANTWLLQPVPLPAKQRGPGFLLLYAGARPTWPSSLPVEAIDLAAAAPATAAGYALFKRYLFEYRGPLVLPWLLLVDDRSNARKVYTDISNASELAVDLSQVSSGERFALPFPGTYYAQPRRNYFKLGAAFYWAGYPDLALPYLNETLRNQPGNWKSWQAIARIHDELGRNEDAVYAYRQLSETRPEYGPAYVGAGEAYRRLNNADEASRMFHRAIEVDPQSADAMNQLGLLAADKNQLSEAKNWFERAIAAQRDHAGAINNIGVLYAKMGKTNDAIAAFRYGIEMAPDDEALYLNLGRIYVTMNKREEARSVLQKLLARKPGNTVASRALAELEAR